MKIRYFDVLTKDMKEAKVVANGSVAFYIASGRGLKAIPREDVAVVITDNKDDLETTTMPIIHYIQENGQTIEFVDFSMLDIYEA